MHTQRLLKAGLASAALAVCGFGAAQERLTLVRELHLDGLQRDLVPIRWVIVRSDGVIAVSQEQDFAVRFFSSTGDDLGTTGRRGRGPGEFENMLAAGWSHDTLWVFDRDQRRLNFIGHDLIALRTASIPAEARSGRGDVYRDLTVVAVYPNGRMLVTASVPGLPVGARDRNTRHHLLLNSSAAVERSFLAVPGAAAIEMAQGSGVAGAMLPFPNPMLTASAPNGRFVASARAVVQGADAGVFHVVMHNANADTLYSRSYRFRGERIRRAEADSVIHARVASLQRRNPELAAAFRRAAANNLPDLHPPLRALTVADDGSLWVRIRRETPSEPAYILLDSRGTVRGTLVVPDGVTIVHASATHVWTTERNEDGVQSVARYRVQAPR